ncbi:MAG: hypothetical protein M3Q29_02565 [Chloroflexota bacterium]|nr:hypothetical protein [Chloroflexota bacterium]
MNYTQEQRAALDSYKRHHGITRGLDNLTPDNLAGIVAWHRKRTGCAPASAAKAYTYGDGAHPLVGRKFTPAEVEQAVRAATPRKAQPAPALVAPLAFKMFSVREVTPYGAWKAERVGGYPDTFTDYLARELGLKSKPRLRWFTEVVEGVKQGDGWQSCSVPPTVTSFNGLFDYITREVWIKDGLDYQREKQLLAHEYRHCWQCDNYGTDYVTTHRDAAEIDADTFASQWG